MKLKKAFTLAEAILTMTILGIIAAVMVTTLKPNQYRTQGFKLLQKKVYAAVDEVTQTILTDCTKGMTLRSIYPKCVKTASPIAFSDAIAETYAQFLRGTYKAKANANGGCPSDADRSSIELKNRACLYFKAVTANSNYEIFVDVNGDEGPNADGDDRFTITLDNNGVSSTMPK